MGQVHPWMVVGKSGHGAAAGQGPLSGRASRGWGFPHGGVNDQTVHECSPITSDTDLERACGCPHGYQETDRRLQWLNRHHHWGLSTPTESQATVRATLDEWEGVTYMSDPDCSQFDVTGDEE